MTGPLLVTLADIARTARESLREAAAASAGEVVLDRGDEIHVRPAAGARGGLTVAIRDLAPQPRVEVVAYVDSAPAPDCDALTAGLGAGTDQAVPPHAPFDRLVRHLPPDALHLPAGSTCEVAIADGRVTSIAFVVPRGSDGGTPVP